MSKRKQHAALRDATTIAALAPWVAWQRSLELATMTPWSTPWLAEWNRLAYEKLTAVNDASFAMAMSALRPGAGADAFGAALRPIARKVRANARR